MDKRTTCLICDKPLTKEQIGLSGVYCCNNHAALGQYGWTKESWEARLQNAISICLICKKPLTHRQILGNAKTCSHDCGAKLSRGHSSIEDFMKDRNTICEVCKKPLTKRQICYKQKTCSHECANKLRKITKNQGDQMKFTKKPETGITELKPNTTTIPNTFPTVDQIINWLLSLSNDDKALLIKAIFPTTDQIANWFLSLSNDDKALLINAIFPTKKIDDLVKAYDLAYPPVRPPLFNVKAGDYVYHPGVFRLQIQEAEKNWLWFTIQSMKIKVDLWGYMNGVHEGKHPIIWLDFNAYAEYAKGMGA